MKNTLGQLISLAALAIATFTASVSAQTQLWQTQQTTSSTYTGSESDKFNSPFVQDQEVADDFQVTGSVQRLVVAGWGCGSCGIPVVNGVNVRFYEWTASGPGSLQHHVFIPEGDPGFIHAPRPYTLDITLPQPFNATGWHFISVQVEFGPGGGIWKPVQGNRNSYINKPMQFRNNLASGGAGGTWAQDRDFFDAPTNADYVLTLFGTPGTATPVIDSLSHSSRDRSGRIIVHGGLWGAEQSTSQLLIDSIPAIVTQWNSDRIVAYVPEAASLGPVPVQVQTAGVMSDALMLNVTARQQQGRVKWRFEVDADIIQHRSGIGPDGSVYVNDYNHGRLYKLSPDGGLIWVVDSLRGEQGLGAEGPVVVGHDGTIYVAANRLGPTVDLLAYNPDGSRRWVFTNPNTISVAAGPNIGPDGNIYIVFNDHQQALGAVSLAPDAGSNGGPATPRWTNPGQPFPNVHAATGIEIAFSSSTLGGPTDQIVVAIDADVNQRIYAFAMRDGQQRWLTPVVMSNSPLMQPQLEAAAGPSGAIYATESNIGSPSGIALQSYNPSDGSRSWVFDPGILSEVTAPVVGGNGVIYLGWDLSRVSAVSPAGNEVWTYQGGPGGVRTIPAISPNNRVVVFGGGPFGQSGYIKGLKATDGSEAFHVNLVAPAGDIFAVPRPAFTADSSTAYVPTGIVNQPVSDEYTFLYAVDVSIGNIAGDVTGDGAVNIDDLFGVINSWGACPAAPADCPGDIAPAPAGNGIVNIDDLFIVINNWGG